MALRPLYIMDRFSAHVKQSCFEMPEKPWWQRYPKSWNGRQEKSVTHLAYYWGLLNSDDFDIIASISNGGSVCSSTSSAVLVALQFTTCLSSKGVILTYRKTKESKNSTVSHNKTSWAIKSWKISSYNFNWRGGSKNIEEQACLQETLED